MSANATEKFLNDLKESSVADSADVDQWLTIARSLNDPGKLADQLVQLGHLTRWQANYLLSGKTRLRFGNYLLVDRLYRDELGDAFVGRHLQLNRPVDMLFLSRSRSDRLNDQPQLIEQLAKAADVDHPILQQVHLIDRDSGRFMLVMSHIDGRSLGDSERLKALRPDDLPAILRQLTEAVSCLHKSGLTHGALSEKTMVVDSEGKLTVTGFLVSLLSADRLEITDQATDVRAIALIGKRLLARFGGRQADATLEHCRAIVDQIAESKMSLSEAASMLGRIEANEHGSVQKAAATDPASQSVQTRPVAVSANEARGLRPAVPAREPGTDQNRTLHRIGSGIAVLLLLVTALWFFGSQFWSGDPDSRHNIAQLKQDSENGELLSLPKAPVKSDESGSDAIDQGTRLQQRAEESSVDPPDSPMREPESEPLKSSDEPKLTESTPEGNGSPPDAKASPTSDELTSILKAFKSLGGQDSKSSASEPEVPAGKLKQDSSGTEPVEAKGQTSNPKVESQGLPVSIALPERTNPDFAPMFGLSANDMKSLELKLVSDDNISKSRIQFGMSGSIERGWIVNTTSPRVSSPLATAALRLENDGLEFNWLAAAHEMPDAEYLRNCVLKCTTASTSGFIALRRPLVVENFVLDRDENTIRVDLSELQFLPKNPVARLHDLSAETYGATHLSGGQEDGAFSRRAPLEIHFSELPEYQMLFVVLAADLKHRSRLEASLHLKLDPSQKSKPASEKSLDAAGQLLDQHFETVKLNHDTLKATPIAELRRQLGLSSAQFKNDQKLAKVRELAQQIEFSEQRAKSFREMRSRLEAFYERPIPATLSFEVKGCPVILATTIPAG